MRLKDNPFCLLDVTPFDSVDIINQNAEDKAFMDDENERLYEDARTTLLSPVKRIAAEVGWIFNRNINSVLADINNGIVNLSDCDSLEKVNYFVEALYKCGLNQLFSVFVGLDQSYREVINTSFTLKALNRINSARKNAGINLCEDETLIQTEIKQKLSEINSAINYLFEKYEDDDLIKITNLIAANTIESGNEYGQVIDALINHYAIHFSDDLTRKKDHILARIEGLKNIFSESGLYSFCEEVRIFDNEAQPIQLFLQKSGQSKIQVESNEVAYALRDFAGFLIDKNNIDGAITLINLGIEVFPELPDIFNVLKEDRKVLLGLKARQTEFAEIDKMINDGWKNVQCDTKYVDSNKQYLMINAPFLMNCLDEKYNRYKDFTGSENDEYYSGCMNCAYYYRQFGDMLCWGALFLDAKDSFIKGKFFAEKCEDNSLIDKFDEAIKSVDGLISRIGLSYIPRLKKFKATDNSKISNYTSTNSNYDVPNNNSINVEENNGLKSKVKIVAGVAILFIALYLFGGGFGSYSQTNNYSNSSSITLKANSDKKQKASLVLPEKELAEEAQKIPVSNKTLNDFNVKSKVLVWDRTKDKVFSHSTLNSALLWKQGDEKDYVVIIDEYAPTQVSTYTRKGGVGNNVKIPGMRVDAVLYVYSLKTRKCLGRANVKGTNPPQNYSSFNTPTAIYGEIDEPLATWINRSFGSEKSIVAEQSASYQAKVNDKGVPHIVDSAMISASHSSADKEGNYVHSAQLAIDGNLNTCWSEGVPGLGVGEYIEINFNRDYEVEGMIISIGHQKSYDLYYQNARPTRVRVIGSDGSNELYKINDSFGTQSVTFRKKIIANKIKIVIDQVTPGNKYEDTCIAEVRFF